MVSPQQEIFTLVRKVTKEVFGENNAYDYLPPKGTKYPFALIGEQFASDTPNKTAVHGEVSQTIHIYHNDWKRRGTLSRLMLEIVVKLRKVKKTKNFYIHILDVDQRVIEDSTAQPSLLHGIIDLRFKFY